MTEHETEGLALLKHYAADADGREILRRMAESIQVAHRFGEKNWTPTVRKLTWMDGKPENWYDLRDHTQAERGGNPPRPRALK